MLQATKNLEIYSFLIQNLIFSSRNFELSCVLYMRYLAFKNYCRDQTVLINNFSAIIFDLE